jgi:NAD(P)-dependent dehydrogenase (short-subunit alcohol dehydrogenase family)
MTTAFKGKVIAITGAGKGLGRVYALFFASRGARIIVNNRSHEGEAQSSADRVVDEIISAGGEAIAEYSSVEVVGVGGAILNLALKNFGRLDSLIANAGVTENTTFRKQSLAELKLNIDINLMGTLNTVHPIFRYMCEKRNGSIIVTVSSAGLFGQMGLPAYSTSKAAVLGLMRSLSLEGSSRNVTVNAVSPYAATQMIDGHVTDEAFERFSPNHVTPVVEWLMTGVVSGETLIVGGGGVARVKMKTTQTLIVSRFDDRDWQELTSSDMNLEFDSGSDNYEKFFASLDS